jgi:paraquat-inducible protein A
MYQPSLNWALSEKGTMNEVVSTETETTPIPGKQAGVLRLFLMVATVTFLLGIFMPMITISKFLVVSNYFSVVSGVIELLRNGQLVLFAVVTGFSIVLPVMKIYVLFRILSLKEKERSEIQRYLHLMHKYGRWAMLDVMVVAVLIVTVKLGAIASITVHLGLFVFGTAVLMIILITSRIVSLTENSDGC